MSIVRVLRRATSAGRAPTIRAIGSRRASSYVNHGRSPVKKASSPTRAHRSSSASTTARAARGWSPSDWPAK
jgi:hypothetical protein